MAKAKYNRIDDSSSRVQDHNKYRNNYENIFKKKEKRNNEKKR